MPIIKDQFDTFFRGCAAEMHVASLFYLAGYEATRIAPDSGVDLIITNTARSKLLGEPFVAKRVQVKSAIVDAGGATLKLKKDELEFLITETDCFTVIVLLHELRLERHIDSFNQSPDVVADQIGKYADDYWEGEISERGRQIGAKKKLPPSFEGASFKTFWLNGAHLKRTWDGDYWDKDDKSNSLQIKLDRGNVLLKNLQIIPELYQIRHVMATESHFGLGSGKIHHEDIWGM